MLESLVGTVVSAEIDHAVIDVGGLRFRADIPASTHTQLPAPGGQTTLLVRLRLNVNEGIFDLYGFATEPEREVFDVLTSLSGIGPRKALQILSNIRIAEFATAIANRDTKAVAKVKGIGPKTADRMIVELREKLAPFAAVSTPGPPAFAAGSGLLPESETVFEAVQALIVLGCRQPVAEKAISEALRICGENATREELIRAGLKFR